MTQIAPAIAPFSRLKSIDQVRGTVMVLMALDHVRWFFTNISEYQPEQLADTNIWLFLTRWVTHYCAPGFFLLAGLGIYLYAQKIQNRGRLTRYLLSRGAFLIILELTVVGFSWVFTPGYSFGGVIWALGWSLVLMAAIVYLPARLILGASVLVLVGHNALLDGLVVSGSGWGQLISRFLYQPGLAQIPGLDSSYFFLYPLFPWVAMMMMGYFLGRIYSRPKKERKTLFLRLGYGFLAAFVLLRLGNLYGNPDTLWISPTTSGNFALQADFWKTLINFLNTEKYPASLQFTLMTLGPILLWLGYSKVDRDNARPGLASRTMILFGRVPLFFYLLHLYLIHLLALATASVLGQPVAWISFGADPNASRAVGYGFDLWVVHLFLIVTVFILYYACRWYAEYKRTHSYPWLKYL